MSNKNGQGQTATWMEIMGVDNLISKTDFVINIELNIKFKNHEQPSLSDDTN